MDLKEKLKQKKQELEKKFNELENQKKQLVDKRSELDRGIAQVAQEQVRLQGEFRAISDLEQEDDKKKKKK